VYGLFPLFFEVIAFAIILLFVGLAALQVLVVALRTNVASIFSMRIVRLAIVMIALVASMVVGILVATMLFVAQFTAMCSRKMSCFLVLFAASCPRQSSQECQLPCRLLDTAQRKQ
jgi:hypothetical protein